MWYSLRLVVLCVAVCSAGLGVEDPCKAALQVTGGNEGGEDVLPGLTTEKVRVAMTAGQRLARRECTYCDRLPARGLPLHRNSSGFFRFNSGPLPAPVACRQRAAAVLVKGLQVLYDTYKSTYKLPQREFMARLFNMEFRVHGLCDEPELNTTVQCITSKYRTYDGSCNNAAHPTRGAAHSRFPRLLPPAYSDGVYSPARATSNRTLPSARVLSLRMFPPRPRPDSRLTLLAADLAQLLAHDCSLAMQDCAPAGPIRCCTDDGEELPVELRHRSCLPVEVPPWDPAFVGRKCMPFVRSVAVPSGTLLGPLEQVNAASSYLDASPVYGCGGECAGEGTLREGRGGRLSCGPLLPTVPGATGCDVRDPGEHCYRAGDPRANQNPHLVALHVALLREHNQLAKGLQRLNPHWGDERLFQEARRVLVAEYQHVVYTEWLPLILGTKRAREVWTAAASYDPRVDAGCLADMSLVFRCMHAAIPDKVRACSRSCAVLEERRLSSLLLRPAYCHGRLDGVLHGLACSPMMRVSACHVTTEVTDRLFRSRAQHGLDLMAMDIQRSRDHGVPGYNAFRHRCGRTRVKDFDQLIPDMGKARVDKLKQCYEHVDDIDLLVGGMLERPAPGAQFGPVILCILEEQFRRFMAGDRYFYTNPKQPYPFTPEQLAEIRKVTVARLICDNGDNIGVIQAHAFLRESKRNLRINCSSLPKMNLRPWKEKV